MSNKTTIAIYKVFAIFEFEIHSSDNEIFGRVTLLQSSADEHKFRMSVSVRDLYSLPIWKPGESLARNTEYSDEVIWTDQNLPCLETSEFDADSRNDAERTAIARIKNFQEHLST
jgi:hypothetical protein